MKLTTWILGALAGAAVTVAVVAGIATAAAQESDNGAPVEHTRFRERVAEHLGISVDQLEAAVKAAAHDAIDDALANDRIS